MTYDAFGYLMMDVDADYSTVAMHKLREVEGTVLASSNSVYSIEYCIVNRLGVTRAPFVIPPGIYRQCPLPDLKCSRTVKFYTARYS